MSFVSRSLHAPLKRALASGIPDHWEAYCLARNRHGSAPPDLRKKLKSVDHGRSTRGASGNYVPYRSSSTSGTVSFSNRAPLIWNSLPNELQEASSVNCFKRLYLKQLSDPSFCQCSGPCDQLSSSLRVVNKCTHS